LITGKIFSVVTPICPLFLFAIVSVVFVFSLSGPLRDRLKLVKLQAKGFLLTNWQKFAVAL